MDVGPSGWAGHATVSSHLQLGAVTLMCHAGQVRLTRWILPRCAGLAVLLPFASLVPRDKCTKLCAKAKPNVRSSKADKKVSELVRLISLGPLLDDLFAQIETTVFSLPHASCPSPDWAQTLQCRCKH